MLLHRLLWIGLGWFPCPAYPWHVVHVEVNGWLSRLQGSGVVSTDVRLPRTDGWPACCFLMLALSVGARVLCADGTAGG